jgi:hypothetical protein
LLKNVRPSARVPSSVIGAGAADAYDALTEKPGRLRISDVFPDVFV